MQTIKQLKDKFISDSESFLTELKKLSDLTNDQLNWKPAENLWSIAECIEHLSISNQLYFFEIEKQFSEKQIACNDEETPVKHRFLGKLIIKTVDPSNIKKTKTFSVFQPSKSFITKDSIIKLTEVQKSLINLISSSVNLNTNEYSMCSPASKFVEENFSDVLEIIRLHNKRHLIQIQKLLTNDYFPKN
uniref:DinB family protein n=1 Tax=Ignavibacterium album TaxID=591197 RepID=A0A832DFW3_9BACT